MLAVCSALAVSCGYRIFHHQPGATRSTLQIQPVQQSPYGLLVSRKTGDRFIAIGDPVITETDLRRVATSTLDRGECAILITFTPPAATRLASFTSDKTGQLLAIIVDGKVVSTPKILGKLSPTVQLRGFSCDEANSIASSIAP